MADNSLDGYPEDLAAIIALLRSEVATITSQLEAGVIDAVEWQAQMETLIVRYSIAAWMVGGNVTSLDPTATDYITQQLQKQFAFLDNFKLVIQSNSEFMQGWYARAEMYANSIVTPYWKGRTKILPLPAMPGEDSICLTACACGWDIVVVDEAKGDYDCYWKLNAKRVVKEHCQSCTERAVEWNPIKIRDGILELKGLIA